MSSPKNKQQSDGSRPLDPDPIWDLVADVDGTRTTQRVCVISWLNVICSRILTKTAFSGGDDGSALYIMPNAALVATSKNTTKTPFLLCTSSTPSSCESQRLLSHDVFIRLKYQEATHTNGLPHCTMMEGAIQGSQQGERSTFDSMDVM